MPRYCVEVEQRTQTITVYHVELDAEDAVDAADRVDRVLSETGTVDSLPAQCQGATVEVHDETDGTSEWQTRSVWKVIETPDPRQGTLFDA